jgi:hypothetical protein
MKKEEEFWKPTIDVAFRNMISNNNVAISLINSFVHEFRDCNRLTEIRRDPENVNLYAGKNAFMDFQVNTQNEMSIIIEIQAKCYVIFDERSLFYASYTFSHQFTDKILREKDWFE